MATKDEVMLAVGIVREFAGNPDVGSIKELLDALEKSVTVSGKTKTSTVDASPVDTKESN
jgi:hypothetical protein